MLRSKMAMRQEGKEIVGGLSVKQRVDRVCESALSLFKGEY